MCGIAGVLQEADRESLEAQVRVALELMSERGPDHSALWTSVGVCLGHTRLSILDLDPRAHQPFLVGEQIALTYNGEIYNFPDLKVELESCGHSFSTTSDTEVLARGYLQWGNDVVGKLDGMFAFAIHDRVKNTLLLARDPFGKKPLYVYQSHREILFASDIRALQKLRRDSLSLNLESLDYYLSELSVPQPRTVWREISQVPAASYREIDLTSFEWTEHRYWSLPQMIDLFEESEVLEEAEARLLAAIQKRTISDVPLGCFLSGGVDSGLVVAMLAANSSERVKTFTVGIEGHPMDESVHARVVAERYNTDHTEVRVRADLQEVTETMSAYCGEPFADSSVIPSFLVCREISQHLKVALSGDGGDELFGGYKDYLHAFRTDRFMEQQKGQTFPKTRVLIDKLLSRVSGRENLGSLEHYSRWSGAQRMFRQIGMDEATKQKVWREDSGIGKLKGAAWLQEKWNEQSSDWLSDHLMRASLSTRLINDYLVKVDRSSMINSLEVRSPLLDKSLAEFAFRISPELKFKGETSKYLLKQLAKKYVDPDICERPKTGFSIPLAEWLAAGKLKFASDILASQDSWIYQYFDHAAVKALCRDQTTFQSHGEGLWTLVCLELWAQTL